MALKEKDFIEIEFTGKVKGGDIFDSNVKKDIEEAGLKLEAKPFAFSLDQGMFLKGVDKFLIGKEIGDHKIELKPEEAFGIRDSKLVQKLPMKAFVQQQLNPIPGAMFNFDGKIGKILTVSGGRVIVDFNNPIAGKEVVYNIKVLRKIDNQDEKIKSFNEFLFKKDFKFEIKDKKLILEVEKQMAGFVKMFAEKFKEVFDLELEVKEVKETKKEESKEAKKE